MNFFLTIVIVTGYLQINDAEFRSVHFNLDDKKLAIQGYDPVSYFSENGPEKGDKKINYSYKGVIYYFISNENKKKFAEMPKNFEPAYGGWCAYALGNSGEKVKVDPETFKIINGRLFLFYNFFFNNTLNDWNENENNLKIMADKNWTKITQ